MHAQLFNTFYLFVLSSQRSCIICAKWLSLLLMRSFCLDLYQRHQSMISTFLSFAALSHSSLCAALSSYSIFFSCRKNVTIKFTRRTDVMPPIPIETKHHPSSVDLLLIKRLITDTSKKTLLQFLQNEFVNINKTLATRLIGKYDINLIWLHKFEVVKYSPSQHIWQYFYLANGHDLISN